jgi:hypothetical protein
VPAESIKPAERWRHFQDLDASGDYPLESTTLLNYLQVGVAGRLVQAETLRSHVESGDPVMGRV